MYTVEEIKQKARKTQLKTIPWVIILEIVLFILFDFNTTMEFSHYNEYNSHTFYYIMLVFVFIGAILIMFLPIAVYNNKRKQLEKENEEERIRRDEYYRNMEEMLKSVTEQK